MIENLGDGTGKQLRAFKIVLRYVLFSLTWTARRETDRSTIAIVSRERLPTLPMHSLLSLTSQA